MRRSRFVFLLMFCLGLLQTVPDMHAQNYPQDLFRYPMDSLPNFVSPFGGLRDNHFHSGADLRTNGKEGMPVYAAADGVVSRIKIQRGGYGKALYLDHGNGYSTVYGHLQKYAGPIADWIHRYQYVNQFFEFDKLFLKPFIQVKKGDTIGWSGNSGASTGPHLHFEIRDTRTEKILNPALFGIIPFDTLSPAVFKVHFYKFVTDGLILKKQLIPSNKNLDFVEGVYQFKDTLELDADTYGIGAEVHDYIHNRRDEKGIYSIDLFQNNKLKFSHRLNQFAFDESKYINAHIDFPYYKLERSRIQKCFVDDGNRFSTYTTDQNKGRIRLTPFEHGVFQLVVKDFNGNICNLYIPYRSMANVADPEILAYQKSKAGKKMLLPGKHQTLHLPGLEIKTDHNTVYDTVFYDLTFSPKNEGMLSKEYGFHTPLTPVHAPFDIAIQIDSFPKGYNQKLLLAYSNPKSDGLRSAGGAYEKGWVRGKGSNFGNYSVVMDTLAPRVKMIHYKNEENPLDTARWDFDISDNFSGIVRYNGFLNGRWILMDYDAKNNLLTYRFDEVYFSEKERIFQLENDPDQSKVFILVIQVEDAKGNVTEKYYDMVPR